MHTKAYDEALALPSEKSALLALRTQQILAHESGVTSTWDPLAGRYYVEALTDTVEAGAVEYLNQIQEMGGAAKAVEFMKEEIHQAAYRFQLQVESGDRTVVGLNAFVEEGGEPTIQQPDFSTLEDAQKARLGSWKAERDEAVLLNSLEGIRSTARSRENLLPPMIEAAKNRATLGEISDVLREEWGSYDQG